MSVHWRNAILVCSSLLLLTACEDSSATRVQQSDGTEPVAASDNQFGGGVGGTGGGPTAISIKGSITGFGSVIVNGVEFETAGDIEIDGEPGSEPDLDLGMVVQIDGLINADGITGIANEISYESDVEGPIADVPVSDADELTKVFTVLGVTVTVENNNTVFGDDDSPYTYESVSMNDLIEASGFFDSDGILHATYIVKKGILTEEPAHTEVTGVISGFNGGDTFNLGTLTVTFDPTGVDTDLSGLPGGTIANGLNVIVEGLLVGASEIFATAIESGEGSFDDDENPGEAGGAVSIEGLVTGFDSNGEFQVAGQSVDASDAVFVPQSFAGELAVGKRIVVEGAITDGVLFAQKVTNKSAKIKIETTVSSVDADNGTVTMTILEGEPGLEVAVTTSTLLQDHIQHGRLDLAAVVPGDYLIVKAVTDDDGNFAATHITLNELNDIRLAAPLESLDPAARTLTLLGHTIPLDDAAVFEDGNGTPIDENQFFSSVEPGEKIKVRFYQPMDNLADKVGMDQ